MDTESQYFTFDLHSAIYSANMRRHSRGARNFYRPVPRFANFANNIVLRSTDYGVVSTIYHKSGPRTCGYHTFLVAQPEHSHVSTGATAGGGGKDEARIIREHDDSTRREPRSTHPSDLARAFFLCYVLKPDEDKTGKPRTSPGATQLTPPIDPLQLTPVCAGHCWMRPLCADVIKTSTDNIITVKQILLAKQLTKCKLRMWSWLTASFSIL